MFSFFTNRLVWKSKGPVSKKGIFKRLELLGLEERITPANFEVINLNDANGGSLRQAIIDANATAENDTITFQSGLTGTITLQSSLPSIRNADTSGTLTITGPGASTLTISGDNGIDARDFQVFRISPNGNLTISGVTVSGAKHNGNGGAFDNSGTLSIFNSIVSKNTASSSGGGIYSRSSATIANTTISGNSATNGSGIFNFGGTAILSINNSTISGNKATMAGGGIRNFGAILSISNSTISGNSAINGGGIDNNASATISNTIIANSVSGFDFAGKQPTTNTNNLVEDGTVTGALSGDPLLGPLQNNGGPTFTHALLSGSVAIAAGDATISNAPPINGLDQRGINRTTSDIGS